MKQTPKTQMTRLRIILAVLVVLVVAMISVVWLVPDTAHADPGCVITVGGLKVCGELLGQPLPEVVTVTVTPDPITLPGPTSTVTVVPEPITTTVPVPVPGPTVTETVTAEPVSIQPSPDSVPDKTQSVSPDETGQNGGGGGTIGHDDNSHYDINFGDGSTNAVEVGIGILTLLALVGLILLTLYAGYILGYKDKERKDTDFIRALLDSVRSKRQ